MLRTKTPRSRGGKARRAPGGASAVKPAKAEGRSPSGELSLQLEHVSLISFLSDRRPAASAAGLTPFEALLEEEDGDGDGEGFGLLPRRSDPGAAASPAAVYAPAATATAGGGTGPAGIADGRGRDHGGEGLGDTVAALIRAALRCYAREGRMPLLGTDPAGFVLSTANGGSGGT